MLITVAALWSTSMTAHAAKKGQQPQRKKEVKKDPYANQGKQLFFLQDRDGMCLGPLGFGACDGRAAWIVADRKEGKSLVAPLETGPGKDMCLERKFPRSSVSPARVGPCSHKGSKGWAVEMDARGLYRVSQDGGKNCLVRARAAAGRKGVYKNSMEMRHCKEGHTGLEVVEVNANTGGFSLQSADGYCFDGERFKACDKHDLSLLWGIGVHFGRSGDGQRYLYKITRPAECLVRGGKGPKLGECNRSPRAPGWSITGGQLADGHWCLVRFHDNTAGFDKCSEAYEALSVVPRSEMQERSIGRGFNY